ncbi:hypothetical protein CC85DRAFT_285110 [Cutaneotrichosporon oleaginosum]|uniref:SH3 domain-containing protein n=1 Tax=Cutaneotrichosporon oleaginosum TaxID=879819 RepID=A0A0J0XPG1_9TREE|nr:uncharacterized protein CC85DRAFT_285110 [Cutaneotrichosporon oleaginosum]KLT42952.1 hypothetical protein CC85DRAFT_285110 [Cutaneotrichosporon oleaginosum]TXT12651.1 hypothetical protein COLE_03061 [Cutaneotrichosporon oleaginosum]
MFSNLSWQDKQAFFALLDEYFESRPHLRPGAGGAADHSSSAPPVSFSSKPSSRPTPPAPLRAVSHASGMSSPDRPGSAATGTSSTHTGSTGGRQLGQAKGAFNDSMAKVTSNSTIKAGLGKVGAGGLANKFSGGSTFKPTGNVPGPGERHLPPAPARSVVGPPPQRNVGGGAKSGGTGAWNDATPAQPVPAYSGAGRAQAVYDFDGGDVNDLPLRAGEVVTIVAKTSPDWWTCRNAEGREGLVPGNYMTEL